MTLRGSIDDLILAAYNRHKGTRRVAADEVAASFGCSARTVFRIAKRKQKTADPR